MIKLSKVLFNSTTKTRVFSFGSGLNGKLGHGLGESKIIKPKEITGKFNCAISNITSGTTYSLFSGYNTNRDIVELYGCGDNRDGQLIIGNGKEPLLEDIRQLQSDSISPDKGTISNRAVKQLISGTYHNICLMSDGQTLLWGTSNSGQLGSPDYQRVYFNPYNNSLLNDLGISKYSCGTTFTLALNSAEGKLYSFGSASFNELGNDNLFNERVPKPIDNSLISSEKIVDIASGFFHSLALTENGRVLTWGRNQEGQCQPVPERIGKGSYTSIDYLDSQTIDSIHKRNDRIVQLAAGSLNSYLLTEQGLVYSIGTNEYGQLGIGKDKQLNSGRLHQVNLPIKVTKLFSKFKSVICTDGHRFFGWGNNFDHQLSLETRSICYEPVELFNINSLFTDSNCEINDISISLSHTLLLMNVHNDLPAKK
ncbi:hypothetical protein DLAC_05330 [Tieghemostelium lacteum]|uniref:Regulator of chromosome condensation domain-containing protein n=1 Tax=Tieghemostelium lacteum TaxID=361077 RepID=A0A151ZIV3_TIELA|nr:hypothetical protein DLAC_05330 [Tieghemostelium lacteum]|eukprot:KYQ93922.1 hypothetical protein DLAC_05330 [Tieghemostelium lacteum]